MNTETVLTAAATRAKIQMNHEFPWLPKSLIGSLGQIANNNVVIPDLELDRQIHSACLISRVYNRLNSIMFENVGHCFKHRPCCGGYPDELTMIKSAPLSDEESAESEIFFFQLMERMPSLEGDGSPVNTREMAPGVYTRDQYTSQRNPGSVVLQ